MPSYYIFNAEMQRHTIFTFSQNKFWWILMAEEALGRGGEKEGRIIWGRQTDARGYIFLIK
jgi:hypothetical protein